MPLVGLCAQLREVRRVFVVGISGLLRLRVRLIGDVLLRHVGLRSVYLLVLVRLEPCIWCGREVLWCVVGLQVRRDEGVWYWIWCLHFRIHHRLGGMRVMNLGWKRWTVRRLALALPIARRRRVMLIFPSRVGAVAGVARACTPCLFFLLFFFLAAQTLLFVLLVLVDDVASGEDLESAE